jgi:branched-chain amino acid transport system permease protein
LAGGLGAFFIPYVSQDSFPPMQSFGYVIMAAIGGVGTVWGGILGVVVVSVFLQVLSNVSTLPGLPPTASPMLQYAGYGILLICVLLFAEKGILPAVSDLIKHRANRKSRPSTARVLIP